MKKIRLLILPLAFIFSLCTNSHKEFSNEIDSYFSEIFPENQPGGAVLIMKGEKIIFQEGYGIADINTNEKVTPNTIFNVGSLSKTFVANGILILAQDKKLSINDNILKHFPDFKNKALATGVLLEHMLSHTSGLVDSRNVMSDSVYWLTAKDIENWEPIKHNDSLYFPSGEMFLYSNPAYNGLALIIENLSGMKWQSFIKERIFGPSNMPKSTITDGPHPESGVAHAYTQVGDNFIEFDYNEFPTFGAAGNGGIWSSVKELANYEIALRKAAFLNQDLIKKSREVFAPENWNSNIPPGIGYSWFLWKEGETQYVGHTGHQGGFVCDYVSIPEQEILYVYLSNTVKPIREYRAKVIKLLKEYDLFEVTSDE
ncbi:serine hydrolase domain-containing protein [Bacteroidota bacterium]